MPVCRECNEEVEKLELVKVDGKKVKLCEDCAERAHEKAEIAKESESVIQGMMEFKGRR
jgi:ribosome-binding protein aMBF1 (putative translation factor)